MSLARLALIAALSIGGPALAVDPFGGQAERYQPDLARYFADGRAEKTDRDSLALRTRAFEDDKNWTAAGAAGRLKTAGTLLSDWMRHALYCRAVSARSISDKEAKAGQAEAEEQADALEAYVSRRLQAPLFTRMDDRALVRHGLSPYRTLIARAAEAARHAPAPGSEAAIAALADPQLVALYERYDSVVRGALDPLKDRAALARDPDPARRRAGADAIEQAYAAHREVLAATLIDVARQETAIAKLRGYASAPERFYAERLGLDEAAVRALLERVGQAGGQLKAYQALRAQRVERQTGLGEAHSWDMALSSGYEPPTRTFEESRALILQALQPLGPAYDQEFAWLLDPAQGALDLAGGANRYRGGFSLGFPGVPAMLYVGGFDGGFAKISVVIHEGGHAVQRKLMGEASPYYANVPKSLAEAFALLNELLLIDRLEADASSPEERLFYQEKFLDKLAHEVFTSAEEGAFEQALYDGVAAGKVATADDLDRLNGDILVRYDIFAEREPALRANWMKKDLLYEDPLYLINYLYAALVACKLYDLAHADPADFPRRYLALLQEGYDAPADTLLRRTLGFGLDPAQLLDGALRLMRERTAKLADTYASR
jgi:oligoendopeptidase F